MSLIVKLKFEKMRKALFPGSFDPFTLGHLDVLLSSLKIFDKIVIAVGYNMQKRGYLSVDERVRIIKESVADIKNVEVASYSGLTIDFCKKIGANFIVRGLRTTTDFELERVIAQANSKMDPSITTLFVPSSAEYAYITSTVVRDVLENGGSVESFMAKGVKIKPNETNS